MRQIEIYDTTLRDGAQTEDISFSVEDKLRITEKLDELGVHYIEGGWPGSNPRDMEYFKKVRKLGLENSKIVAFGSTHSTKHKADDDANIKALLDSRSRIITIFGKTWDFHVKEALKISYDENIDIIHNSVAYLKKNAGKVFFDAEHFFDGYKHNPQFALKCLLAAQDAGADCLILCDTNGGTLPADVKNIINDIVKDVHTPLGIHAHNDSECAVANSIIAVEGGASHVQGTINGLGERCGNANLCSVIPNLQVKREMSCITAEQLRRLRDVSRFVNEIANLRHFKRQPFVGDSAFAHKAGIHVSAVRKRPETYEHIRPDLVGNSRRVLISDLAGRSSILRKAEEFGIHLDPDSPQLQDIVSTLKNLENEGFQFEAAEASFELLMRKALGLHKRFFDLIGFRIIVEKRREGEDPISEATIMVKVGGRVEHTAATGNGPVNAIDNALRKALDKFYPELKEVSLHDYKVRVLTAGKGTSARVRVLIESGDEEKRWGTVGVSENIIEASYQALVDSIEYKLLKEEG
ncbi:MAG: citramalate synthase [Nitrospirae bacterium CG_4_10_14_0_8_um_filter_41_23]|nr:citramalate synthase [Nitrospirota bacterium]OIP60958.1 MAG: citramalate synthase [Nitrospirae bacterium CG2_30_41_42]PIQ93247.1 MAG: citramalate synthase [Nitrospirae bacterium CG11_big_fil_rev_8_21_14_0_20_41_14]PIV43164.1 MAG: citramalate synthase [Nitrospirae bacterium CG02_land_8_20_14_3_00_41_53]PIW87834.1 MAG: citramalate synthase [Nitrospirae bacterium CG_4_8_14_3_um_filter_41_47]PIY87302.1 MAG: citramalate synthase [Nitrospirae bacterium CG_4_10_14_0_8_um_filter_41_23]PJA79857.1 M